MQHDCALMGQFVLGKVSPLSFASAVDGPFLFLGLLALPSKCLYYLVVAAWRLETIMTVILLPPNVTAE